MPILPQEPDIFPEDLLEKPSQLSQSTWSWWAIHTRPRREKELARRLRRWDLHHYLPLVPRRNRSPAGRVRTSYVPLFPSYMFFCGNEEQRYQILTTNCVAGCLKVPDSDQLVHDLLQIRRLIESDAPLTPEARISPGTRVRIKSGPFVGMEGTVIKRRERQRLLVVVGFLQQGASIDLEDVQVEQIDG
ncbi:MAG: antitermination protein NusG [Planctomycetes bacterium]|nr:antitermination protein NusG [Planctomycetota bacterium]